MSKCPDCNGSGYYEKPEQRCGLCKGTGDLDMSGAIALTSRLEDFLGADDGDAATQVTALATVLVGLCVEAGVPQDQMFRDLQALWFITARVYETKTLLTH